MQNAALEWMCSNVSAKKLLRRRFWDMSANHQNTLVCWKTKDALCLQDFFVALTIQELELSQKSRCQKEKWEQTAREIFSIFMYAGKKKSRLEKRNQKNQLHGMLTLFLQRSWRLGRRGRLCWSFQTFLELADHLFGKICWGHSGPNSS